MKRSTSKPWKTRRGIIAVLSAVLFIVMLAMVAFAVDVGYMDMVRTQLQAAADSAALAAAGSSNLTQDQMKLVAQAFAQYHQVAGRSVALNTNDVLFGTWDTTSRAFGTVTTGQMETAVKVTVYADTSHGGNASLFFGNVLGIGSKALQASAVAMCNPRDICFVVDLSGSMNDDTTPGSGSASSTLIQAVYDDLFGKTSGASNVTYSSSEKGTSQSTGSGDQTVANMNLVTTKKKYMIPAPDTTSADSRAYWASYFAYLNGGKISYKSYVTFLMNYGRNKLVVTGTSPQYSIMSVMNPNFHSHPETTDGGTFQFPTPEMPTHAIRRAIIDALQLIKTRNSTINDTNQKDWVSLVVFDKKNTGTTTTVYVKKSLTDNYDDVMQSCVTLQACMDDGQPATDSEGGLLCAYNHIKGTSQGGAGRDNANKVVVFLTDGLPNLYESSNGTIDAAMTAHPGGWGTDYSQNGALMQAMNMQSNNWYVYAVGVGLGGDQTFMNLMANKGGTAITNADGTKTAYPLANNATTYETTVKGIFNNIISNPKLRLVQ
jgi:Putative Flp pilus-assembly TadE/G-like/von Willebrand factor type A domain